MVHPPHSTLAQLALSDCRRSAAPTHAVATIADIALATWAKALADTPRCASEDIALRRPLITMNTPPLPLLPLPDHPPVSTFFRASTLCLPHFPLLSLFSFSSCLSLHCLPLDQSRSRFRMAQWHGSADDTCPTCKCIHITAADGRGCHALVDRRSQTHDELHPSCCFPPPPHSHTSSQGAAPTRVLARVWYQAPTTSSVPRP